MESNSILVVDDIKKNIQLLGSLLSQERYAVSYATSGTKALEMINTENFDLILLDVMMPEMDGFEVCRRLKQHPDSSEIPILFLTAKSEEKDILEGFELGAVDYLTKPFKGAELLARVKTHLSLRQAVKQLAEKNSLLEQLLEDNRKAMSEIKTLRGILPICANCKKIRNDKGYWTQIETYIKEHSEANFTHGICRDCTKKLYPFYDEENSNQ